MARWFTDEEWRDYFLPAYYPLRRAGLSAHAAAPMVEGLTGSLRPAVEAGIAAVLERRRSVMVEGDLGIPEAS